MPRPGSLHHGYQLRSVVECHAPSLTVSNTNKRSEICLDTLLVVWYNAKGAISRCLPFIHNAWSPNLSSLIKCGTVINEHQHNRTIVSGLMNVHGQRAAGGIT
jgi:hypothetical protein